MTEDVYLGKHYLTETSGSAIETWFVVAIIILSQLRIHVNDQSKVNNQNKLNRKIGVGVLQYIVEISRYQKCVHREVTNAKPNQFHDSAF